MPSGLTFAGRAWRDADLLAMAWEYDNAGRRRLAPPRTPELPASALPSAAASGSAPQLVVDVELDRERPDSRLGVVISGQVGADGATGVEVTVNGERVPSEVDGRSFRAATDLPGDVHNTPHSTWRAPYGSVVIVTVTGPWGTVGGYRIAGGV